jgi:hypothetical protein
MRWTGCAGEGWSRRALFPMFTPESEEKQVADNEEN